MPLSESLLQAILEECGVDTSCWGRGPAKTVGNLLEEIRRGESHLKIANGGVTRVVLIVKMIIRDPRRPQRGCLLEKRQTLPDGRTREVNQNPSGKIMSGESPEDALMREIGPGEELGLLPSEYQFSALPLRVEERASRSYPGLRCVYEVHPFEVAITNPESPVFQDSFSVTEKDGTILYFEWGKGAG